MTFRDRWGGKGENIIFRINVNYSELDRASGESHFFLVRQNIFWTGKIFKGFFLFRVAKNSKLKINIIYL
jgi:hypothetical protein